MLVAGLISVSGLAGKNIEIVVGVAAIVTAAGADGGNVSIWLDTLYNVRFAAFHWIRLRCLTKLSERK